MFDNKIGLSSAELLHGVIASQYCTGPDASMPCRLDIVLHVADEERLVGFKSVLSQEFVEFCSFVPDIDVGAVQIFIEPGHHGLNGEMVAMHGAQEECAHLASAAEFEEVAGMRQLANQVLDLFEATVEPI